MRVASPASAGPEAGITGYEVLTDAGGFPRTGHPPAGRSGVPGTWRHRPGRAKGQGRGRKREGGAGAGPPGASSDTGGGSTGSADPARGYAVGSAAGTPAAPGTPRSQSMHVSRGAAGGVSSAKGT